MQKHTLRNFGGIDTRHAADSTVFQPPRSEDAKMFLRECVNAYITDDNKIYALPGTQNTLKESGSGELYSCPAGLLLHDKNTHELILNPHTVNPTVVVSGLDDAPVVFHQHQGFTWWSDGETLGRIGADGASRPGTLPETVAPNVTEVAGSLPPGTYLVAYTWVDATGMESACSALAEVMLNASGGLEVGVDSLPADVVAARLYCSSANGDQARLVGTYTTEHWPVSITEEPSAQTVLQTAGLLPLPVGSGITSRGGFLLTWLDDLLFHSRGDATALCDLTRDVHQFPGEITGAVGVEQGVWVATTNGLYWMEGRDLTQSHVSARQDTRAYASGGVLIPPEVTGIETGWPCACFVSDEGPVFGTADGQIVVPYASSQRWDIVDKQVDIAVWEFSETKQIMVNII